MFKISTQTLEDGKVLEEDNIAPTPTCEANNRSQTEVDDVVNIAQIQKDEVDRSPNEPNISKQPSTPPTSRASPDSIVDENILAL